MQEFNFIEEVAKYIKKYASSYGIKVFSPIIAQAIVESGFGKSELAINANNYFGLKYRPGRCKNCIGVYVKEALEQNKNGTYNTYPNVEWCKFKDLEQSVIGYFDFINIYNYYALKGVKEPKQYLIILSKQGYSTSLNYVDKLMSIIKEYDLTKYDNKEIESMNSKLISYTNISNNKNSPRNHKIDRITPHCIVGQWSAKQGCDFFASTGRQVSSNYVIGTKGEIGLSVDESDRSWCSSNADNDHRAITIECASDTVHPYTMNLSVYKSLIDLCTDICKRYNKTELLWFADKNKSLSYTPKNNEMILTVHRWFAPKACPGDWLYSRLGELAEEVTKRLNGVVVNNANNNTQSYLVKVTAYELNIRTGAGTNYPVNGIIKNQGTYTIVEEKNGIGATKWGKLKSGAGWISLDFTRKV